MAALIGSIINPDGFFRFYQPFKLHGLPWGQATSMEMWPITLGQLWLPLICTIITLAILIIRMQERRGYWILIVLLALQYLIFISSRYTIFIGLTLLIIVWDEVRNTQKSFSLPFFQLPFALIRLMVYFIVTLRLLFLIIFTFESRWSLFKDHNSLSHSQSLVITDSSFAWLQEHPAETYTLLSHFAVGSWAQMPGQKGIYPLLDSGTHRYSDRVNQLYYYLLFSPETFKLGLSKLHINTIIIGRANIYWASILNANPDWCLTYIESDSQLYLRRSGNKSDADPKLFSQWEEVARHEFPDFKDISYENIVRGLKLRPDSVSMQMLLATQDVSWMFDPQISYVQDWLRQVPDDLVRNALKNIGNKTDNASAGLRILLSLRLNESEQATEVAYQWHPSFSNGAYQAFQELRIEAFISRGKNETAQKLLESLWPQPRYSLRWAQLCQQVYASDPKDMPENARLLTGLVGSFAWQEDLITSLNQNILSLPAQLP